MGATAARSSQPFALVVALGGILATTLAARQDHEGPIRTLRAFLAEILSGPGADPARALIADVPAHAPAAPSASKP